MKKIMCFVLAGMCMAACNKEEKKSYPPTFSGFKCVSAFADQVTLTALTVGDSIIISAMQSQKGAYIYKADYKWTLRFRSNDGKIDSTMIKIEDDVVYDYSSDDPVVRLRLFDKPGSLDVRFKAEYHYSVADAEPVNYNKGGFTVVGSTLLGSATGGTNYNVYEK